MSVSPVLLRLWALINLTKSESPGEASNAATKACEMILKHRLIILEPGELLLKEEPESRPPEPMERSVSDLAHMRKQFEDILGKDHPEILAAKRKSRNRNPVSKP